MVTNNALNFSQQHIRGYILQLLVRLKMQNIEGKYSFHEKANTFSLSVVYQCKRLTITLKDFLDWAVYVKVYIEDDIGKQIHRKMDLLDVFSAFSQSKVSEQNRNSQHSQHSQHEELVVPNMIEYQFGQVITINGVPCYKIEKDGKITVYSLLINKRTNQETTYESNLKIEKLRDLTKAQINQQKSEIEKWNLCKKLIKKLQRQEQQKANLLQNIFVLKQQNLELKNTLMVHTSQQQELTPVVKFEQIPKLYQIARETKLEQTQTNWNCAYFKLDGSKITYTGLDKTWTHYIFDESIRFSRKFRFKIRIIKTSFKNIMIGVVNLEGQKQRRSFLHFQSAIYYSGNHKTKFPENKREGPGIKQSDVIEVIVNRRKSDITYIINGVKSVRQKNENLRDDTKVFMPYVELYNTKDTIQWIEVD